MANPNDTDYLQQALMWAAWAGALGEVPVGAVLVHPKAVIGGFNRTRLDNDPSAHAEMVVLRRMAAFLGNFRLTGATLYVTLEPCPMCAGAILQARLARVVYILKDPKIGACGSRYTVLPSAQVFPTRVEEVSALAPQSSTLLKNFFAKRRS